MSTSATGPDHGKYDEQGVGEGPAGDDPATAAAVPDDVPPTPPTPPSSRPSAPPHSGERIAGTDPGVDGGTGRPDYGQPDYGHPGFGQGQYPPAPSQQGPFPQGQYQQAPYAQAPYGQGGYNQGPFGQPYAPQKSRVVAGVLGILLGSLGIHRFYLGFTTIGIIQILMSTVGAAFTFGLSAIAAGIWGLIEGIMILVGSEQFRRDAQGIPLKD